MVLFIHEEKEQIRRCLKGQSHEIFYFRFLLISRPQASDYSHSTFSNPFEKFAKNFAPQGRSPVLVFA